MCSNTATCSRIQGQQRDGNMRAMNKPSVHDMIAHPCTVFSSSGVVTYEPFPPEPERGFGILSEMSHPKSYTEVVEGATCRRRLSTA